MLGVWRMGIDLGREPASDETTVLTFRHLLERHGLGAAVRRVKGCQAGPWFKIGTGTCVVHGEETFISRSQS